MTIIRTEYYNIEDGIRSQERPAFPIYYDDAYFEVHDLDNPQLKTLVVRYRPFRYA